MFIINSPPNSATTRWCLTARTSRWRTWRGRSWAGRSCEPGTATCRSPTHKPRKVISHRHTDGLIAVCLSRLFELWKKTRGSRFLCLFVCLTAGQRESVFFLLLLLLLRHLFQLDRGSRKVKLWQRGGANEWDTFLLHLRLTPVIRRPGGGGSARAGGSMHAEVLAHEMCLKIAQVWWVAQAWPWP